MKIRIKSLAIALAILAAFMLLSSLANKKTNRLQTEQLVESIYAIKALEAQVLELESLLSEKATVEQPQ